MIDVKQSLAHTTWNCKYHIVFAPKYRRKVFYKEKRREVGKILRTLCEWKKVRILEAEVCLTMCIYMRKSPAFAGLFRQTEGRNTWFLPFCVG